MTDDELTTSTNRRVGISYHGVLYITRSDQSNAETAYLSITEHARLVEILTRSLRGRLDDLKAATKT